MGRSLKEHVCFFLPEIHFRPDPVKGIERVFHTSSAVLAGHPVYREPYLIGVVPAVSVPDPHSMVESAVRSAAAAPKPADAAPDSENRQHSEDGADKNR